MITTLKKSFFKMKFVVISMIFLLYQISYVESITENLSKKEKIELK